jgi:hypothetical protein
MSRAQRLAFLGIAVIIAVVAGILLADGGGETEKAANPAPSATPTATPSGTATATPSPAPKPKAPLLQAGNERTLSFDEGDTVRFRVRHDDAEEVHIHGYDIKQELAPNRTATVSFKASITGIFEIELEHSGTLLAHLKVEP